MGGPSRASSTKKMSTATLPIARLSCHNCCIDSCHGLADLSVFVVLAGLAELSGLSGLSSGSDVAMILAAASDSWSRVSIVWLHFFAPSCHYSTLIRGSTRQ